MNKRTLNLIIILLIVTLVGFYLLTTYQRVRVITSNIEVILTETSMTRTAIARP